MTDANQLATEELLDNAANTHVVGPAPLRDLVEGGNRLRRRRRYLHAAGISGTVAAVVAASVVVATAVTGSSQRTPPPIDQPAALDVPEGARLVGMNGVAVAVPSDWATPRDRCGVLPANSPRPGDFAPCVLAAAGETSVTAAPTGSPFAAQWMVGDSNRDEVDGVDVVRTRVSLTCPSHVDQCPVFAESVRVPNLDVIVWVKSGTGSLPADILDTLRLIPTGRGYTTVPAADRGRPATSARDTLAAAGFDAEIPDNADAMHLVVDRYVPSSFAVVPADSSIEVVTRPPADAVVGVWTPRVVQGKRVELHHGRLSIGGGPSFHPHALEITFAEDGTWHGTDGCNVIGGTYVRGKNDELQMAITGGRTLIGCAPSPTSAIANHVASAHLTPSHDISTPGCVTCSTFTNPRLTFDDAAGKELATYIGHVTRFL